MKIDYFSSERFPLLNFAILHSRITWSIMLRWFAVAGFYLAVIIAKNAFQLNIPIDKVSYLLGGLAFINFIYYIICKRFKQLSFKAELFVLSIHIIIDLLALTYLIHLTGGVDNPIYIFFVFHLVISSFIFPRWIPYVFATFVIVLFNMLVWFEYSGIWVHYSIFGSDMHTNFLFLILVLIVFILTAYMTTYICTTFMRLYRQIKSQVDLKNKELINLNEEKIAFFRFTSHELKSPIIAVKSSIDTVRSLYGKNLEEKGSSLLSRASDRTSQMLNIINELLELSKSRNITGEPETTVLNVNEIIKYNVENEQPRADEKHVKLVVECEVDPLYVNGNYDDFNRIFNNLISNGVRYTPENGEVKIRSTKYRGKAVIFVNDTGIGIPKKDLETVFSEFFRSENAKKIVTFGTGLGLSLVQSLVEKYGGSIQVKSEVDKGTEFKTQFPLVKLANKNGKNKK